MHNVIKVYKVNKVYEAELLHKQFTIHHYTLCI